MLLSLIFKGLPKSELFSKLVSVSWRNFEYSRNRKSVTAVRIFWKNILFAVDALHKL